METQALRGEVEAAYAAWNGAFDAGDAGALAAFYTTDTLLLPVTREVIEGPAGVERFFAGLFATGVTGHRLELLTLQADTGTLVAAARWSARARKPDGSERALSGNTVHVFAREPDDGSLKIRLHIFN